MMHMCWTLKSKYPASGPERLTLQCTSLQLLHPKIHSELRLRAARTELEACILARPVTMDRSFFSSSIVAIVVIVAHGSTLRMVLFKLLDSCRISQCVCNEPWPVHIIDDTQQSRCYKDAPLCVWWMTLKTNHVLPATQIQNTTNTYNYINILCIYIIIYTKHSFPRVWEVCHVLYKT